MFLSLGVQPSTTLHDHLLDSVHHVALWSISQQKQQASPRQCLPQYANVRHVCWGSPLRYSGLGVVLRMEGAEEPSRAPKRLFAFNSREDIDQFATGCDADVGGLSTMNFALDESTATPPVSEKSPSLHSVTVDRPTGKFWGEMKLAVRHGLEGQIRAGYAGFRSKVRPGLPLAPMCSDDRTLSSLSQPSLVS